MLEKALEKLESQFKAEKDPIRKQFAEPILEHLKKRCREDEGLCKDILQEHKTWSRLYSYITQTARKHISGNAGAVPDHVVYEWAEDYYRKDDKAEVEKKEKNTKKDQKSQKASGKGTKPKAKSNTSKAAKTDVSDSEGTQPAIEKAKPRKQKQKKTEADGQMNIFDFLGGE